MNAYKRDGKFLVVFGDIPQWLVVDDFGFSILKKIISGISLEQIISKYSLTKTRDVKITYEELQSLINRKIERDSLIVENALTTKTTVAMISVTKRCNLQLICPHCYVDAGGSRDFELTEKEHKKIAKQICESLIPDKKKVYKINLTGGEPFIHRNILQIIRAYYEKGLRVNMSTNGLLIKDADMDALAKMNVVLSVSLDGASPGVHDQIRGIGSWKRVTEKIRRLVRSGVKVGINCLLHEGNFFEFEQIVSLSHKLGCSGFNPINLVQLGRACRSSLRRVSEVKIFKRLANHLIRHPEERHLFNASSLFSSLGAALLAGITCENCGAGNRPCVYIDETGNVYPCPNTQRKEFLLGNIRKVPLSECVKLDHPILKRLRTLQVSTLNDRCASCDIRFFCGGDCRGETYNVTENLRNPYVACEDRHDSIIELMWIVAEHPEFFKNRAEEYISNLH